MSTCLFDDSIKAIYFTIFGLKCLRFLSNGVSNPGAISIAPLFFTGYLG